MAQLLSKVKTDGEVALLYTNHVPSGVNHNGSPETCKM